VSKAWINQYAWRSQTVVGNVFAVATGMICDICGTYLWYLWGLMWFVASMVSVVYMVVHLE
jgi:hypothetical protein